MRHKEEIEGFIKDATDIISQLKSTPQNKNDELLHKLTASFLVLYNKIDQQYSGETEKEMLIKEIEAILVRDNNIEPYISVKINEAKNLLPLYQKIKQAFEYSTKQTDTIIMENNIATLFLKIDEIQNSTVGYKPSPFIESLYKEAESFFKKFDNDVTVNDFVERLSKCIKNTHPQAFETVAVMATSRVNKIREERSRQVKESEQELRFKQDSDFASYFQSADAKTLAINLDRNMRSNHVVLDKLFEIDPKVQAYFPQIVLEKIGEVGQELEKLQKVRSTFVGRVKQKAGDYIARVINTFSKLAGKKVDDPMLEAAIKEYNLKIEHINEHLSTEHQEAKQLGKFVNQVLASQQGKVTRAR